MKTTTKLSDMKKGEARNFEFEGKNAILVRTKDDNLVAYYAHCPHQDGTIEWDAEINFLLCECHMAIFNPLDGNLHRSARGISIDKGLTPLNVTVDEEDTIHIS